MTRGPRHLAGGSCASATLPHVADLLNAVYIGGNHLQTPDGEAILPGDRRDMPAEIVDQPGSDWATRIPHGQADRLRLLAGNITAAVAGAELTPDPHAAPDTAQPEE